MRDIVTHGGSPGVRPVAAGAPTVVERAKCGEWTMIFAPSSTINSARNRLIIVNQCFGGNDSGFYWGSFV